jgi:predicted nuclease of predicted toxin-antitoxin system
VKLLLDENLSPRLAAVLSDLYPGSEHVEKIGLGRASDADVWSYAKANGFAIVSKDSDFAERSVLESEPPKVIWIRLGNCSTSDAARTLRSHYETIRGFLEEDPETCLLLESGQSSS